MAYQNSNIPTQGVIAGTTEVSFTETGNYQTDVSALRKNTQVQALRESVGADFVSLFVSRYDVPHNWAGYAYIMQSFTIQYEQLAFSVVQFHEAGITNLFAHEVGHNMGCDHNVENTTGYHVESDAFGGHFVGQDGLAYGTVMSYVGTPTYNFSNPAIYFQQTATGVLGQVNNAAAITATIPYFTRFRPTVPFGTVTVTATQPVASAAIGTVGQFTFTRRGGITELPLIVYPTLGGSGVAGVDYNSARNWNRPLSVHRPPVSRLSLLPRANQQRQFSFFLTVAVPIPVPRQLQLPWRPRQTTIILLEIRMSPPCRFSTMALRCRPPKWPHWWLILPIFPLGFRCRRATMSASPGSSLAVRPPNGSSCGHLVRH